MLRSEDLEQAEKIVYAAMAPTPQYRWPLLEKYAGCEIWIKHENHTPIGCFKLRGGLSYLDYVRRSGNAKGVIAPTRGNHGQSIALAAQKLGVPATIIVPHGNQREKNEAIIGFGARLIEHGEDYQAAREEAIRMADEQGYHMVRSFTPQLLRGVATYAVELFTAVRDLDIVYVPIGMGSGASATILVRDMLGLSTEVVGVVAKGAPAYALSFEAGVAVATQSAQTIADGLACRTPDPGAVDLFHRRMARVVQVDDHEILNAISRLLLTTHNLAEPAGAASVAALLKERSKLAGKRAAAILSGGNIDAELLTSVTRRCKSILRTHAPDKPHSQAAPA